MKYCTKCGQQVEDNTSYCPNCGYHFTDSNSSDDYFDDNFGLSQSTVSTNGTFSSANNQIDNVGKNESPVLGILSIIFSGIIGLILAIIGLSTYKKKPNRTLSIVGLSLSLASIFIRILFVILDIDVPFLSYI